jgi:hypothetical protein
MKRRKYPESFERLWKSFDTDFGEKGSKIKALEVFIKMEINDDDVEFIIERYTKQRMAKELQRFRGEFFTNFQHVERYLTNERFDDEISLNTYQQHKLTKSEKSDAELRKYIARDDGEGMADIASDGQDTSRDRLN